MKMKSRAELIQLLTAELTDSVERYDKALDKDNYAMPGYNVEFFDSKAAIQRRIKVLREELQELSKSL